MAKSMTQIRMDYNKANRQAQKLDEIAAQLRKSAETDLNGGLKTLSGTWKSDTAAGFIRKGNTMNTKLLNEAKEMSRAAEALRKMAKNTYEAEKEACRLATTRTY